MGNFTEENDGQLAMDTRLEADRSFQENVDVSIDFACRQLASEATEVTKNRHEGYGIVAEQFGAVNAMQKKVAEAMKNSLGILPTDDIKAVDTAVDTAASLKQAATEAAYATIKLAALADKVANDLYKKEADMKTPLEEYAESAGAEESDFDEIDTEEDSEDEES